jgi:Family of unknown function (DUF6879)
METFDIQQIQVEFEKLFAAAKSEMFKAEVLQDYSAIDDSPSLRAWLAGDKAASRKLAAADQSRIDWRKRCLASPADITRVHVVDSPLTPYLEWEVDVLYKGSLLPSGAEQVFLVSRSDLQGLALPAGDFWIFDSSTVLEWKFDDGNPAGGIVWDKTGDISRFLELRRKLLRVATPLV